MKNTAKSNPGDRAAPQSWGSHQSEVGVRVGVGSGSGSDSNHNAASSMSTSPRLIPPTKKWTPRIRARSKSPGSSSIRQSSSAASPSSQQSPPDLLPSSLGRSSSLPRLGRMRRARREMEASHDGRASPLVLPSTSGGSSESGMHVSSSSPSVSSAVSSSQRHRSPGHLPSSLPSYGSTSRLGKMRRARRDLESSETVGSERRNRSSSLSESNQRYRSGSIGSPLMASSSENSPRFGGLIRTKSNPFLKKPLHISTESLPLLGGSGSMMSMHSSNMSISESHNNNSEMGTVDSSAATSIEAVKELHSPPVATHGNVERHMTLLDLIAVGVGGTLGTGFFLLCSLVSSSYAGPSAVFCWLLSAVPALLSGFCFAELAGQIPAAGSTYAYVYASMGELPAVVAAGCLSLEYLVSASAIARGWGDKMVEWILTKPGIDEDGWVAHILQPGWGSFNPMSFLLTSMVALLLLDGNKESKAVTNYFTAFKMVVVAMVIFTGLGLFEAPNLRPFLPPKFGIDGFFAGGTVSFMGYLGYDEVCCLTAEAIDPQKNMPRAIMWTMAILTFSYMAGTLALSGMLPNDQIDSIGGFPDAFEARGVEWASSMAAYGELLTLPLVVLVAVMAQPRLTFALACDGLIPPWFGQVDEAGNIWNGTLFAGLLMILIASFVPLKYLNDLISAGVLVAFSMTNSSLILLRHESPDDNPGLLEKLLTCFNVICFLSSLLLTHICTSVFGNIITSLCWALALLTCVLIKLWCPAAAYFGGKTRHTTQHMTVGVVLVEDESFRTPLLPFVPCIGICINWYLIAQLPWSDLAFLTLFLSCAVAFYFLFGYHFSVGNNGGWELYDSCGLSIHSMPPSPNLWGDEEYDNEHRFGVVSIDEDDGECDGSENDSVQGLPLE